MEDFGGATNFLHVKLPPLLEIVGVRVPYYGSREMLAYWDQFERIIDGCRAEGSSSSAT